MATDKEINDIFKKNGNGFPKFQWSIFSGAGREQQFVVRSNNFEEFEENRKKILDVADFGTGRPKIDGRPSGEAPVCGIHKVRAEWKEGTSKAGKPYAFWACPERMPDGGFCTYKMPK